jgi:voltage-gated potassium channel
MAAGHEALPVNATTFVASAALVAGIRTLSRGTGGAARPFRVILREGLTTVRGNPVVRAVATGFLVMVAFAAPDNVALVPFARDGGRRGLAQRRGGHPDPAAARQRRVLPALLTSSWRRFSAGSTFDGGEVSGEMRWFRQGRWAWVRSLWWGRAGGPMIHFPLVRQRPLRALAARVVLGVGLVCVVVVIVYADRGGYSDGNEDGLSLLDCFYYAVVSLSTTGYGDIAPLTPRARLTNVVLITPARLLFVIILVGTTLEVLTHAYRNNVRVSRWRQNLHDHVIICGYGTKGRAAVAALLENGHDKSQIVLIERGETALRQAATDGLAAIEGSATRSSVLLQAEVKNCRSVIIATDRDATSVLITLTVRQLTAGQVRVIAAVREQENAALLKQSGAHHVIVSSATAGRLLGLTTTTPPLIDVVDDLLTPGHGMALAMRAAERAEVGRNPRELDAVVVALIRRGTVLPLADGQTTTIETGDMLFYIRAGDAGSLTV